MLFFGGVFEIINISSGQREKNQSSPAGLRCCMCLSMWAVGERAGFLAHALAHISVYMCVFFAGRSSGRQGVFLIFFLNTPCQILKATV